MENEGAYALIGLVVFIGLVLIVAIWRGGNGQAEYCRNCGWAGDDAPRRGSAAIELLLWLCGGIFGLLYTAWRGGAHCCPSCHQQTLIPADSPAASQALDQRQGTWQDEELAGRYKDLRKRW